MPGRFHFDVITVRPLRDNGLQRPGEATRCPQAVAVVARDKVALHALDQVFDYFARLPHTLVSVMVPATTSILMSKRLISTLKLLCVMSYWCLQENRSEERRVGKECRCRWLPKRGEEKCDIGCGGDVAGTRM